MTPVNQPIAPFGNIHWAPVKASYAYEDDEDDDELGGHADGQNTARVLFP
jgi:hypothetical protein